MTTTTILPSHPPRRHVLRLQWRQRRQHEGRDDDDAIGDSISLVRGSKQQSAGNGSE